MVVYYYWRKERVFICYRDVWVVAWCHFNSSYDNVEHLFQHI